MKSVVEMTENTSFGLQDSDAWPKTNITLFGLNGDSE